MDATISNNAIPPAPDGSQAVTQPAPSSNGAPTSSISNSPMAIPPAPDGTQAVQPTPSQGDTTPTSDNNAYSASSQLSSGISDDVSLAEGAGHGLADTAHGLVDLSAKEASTVRSAINKFLPASMQLDTNEPDSEKQVSDWLQQHSQNTGTDDHSRTEQSFGYGGETLMEFLLGDEALKGLSFADKLAAAGKTAKVLEGSPKLMQAVKIGAAKIAADAARAGVVQGAQTGIRSGSGTEALESGAGAAATTGVLGAAFGGAAHVLGKGGEAANTISDMNNLAETAPTAEDANLQLSNAVDTGTSQAREGAQAQVDQAGNQIQQIGANAPGHEQITQNAQKMVKAADEKLHTDYQEGLGSLKEQIGDAAISHEGSPLQKAAKGAINDGEAQMGPLDQALRKTRPGSAKVNALLDDLASPTATKEAEASEEGPGAGGLLQEFINPAGGAAKAAESGEPVNLTLDNLIEARHKLGENMRKLGYTSEDNADRSIYSKLIQGVDDTIGQLAEQADAAEGTEGGEEGEGVSSGAGKSAKDILNTMNTKYKNGVALFKNKDVQSLLKGNVNDIGNRLIRGETSLDDIDAVRKVVGDENFAELGKSTLARLVADSVGDVATGDAGKLDYGKFLTNWNRIKPEVRLAMFGNEGATSLTDALNSASEGNKQLAATNDLVSELTKGDASTLIDNPQRVAQLRQTIGPRNMGKLGQSLLEAQIGKASTALDPKTGQFVKTRFDPDKVLEWWNGMKDSPEVRDGLFTVDKDTTVKYNDLMSRLAQASSVKKLVKYGVLPLTLGTAGVVHGPGAALVGALAGLGTEAGFGRARDILDAIANNPRTWRALSAGGRLAPKLTSPAVKTASSGLYNVLNSTAGALSSQPQR